MLLEMPQVCITTRLDCMLLAIWMPHFLYLHFDTILTLQASAVVDRIRRAIATTSDNVSSRIGPIATSFGKAFGVDDW